MTRFIDTKPLAHDSDALPTPQVRVPVGYRPHCGVEVDTDVFASHSVSWGMTSGGLYLPVAIDTDGQQIVQVAGDPATEAKQDTLIAKDFATLAKQDELKTELEAIQAKSIPEYGWITGGTLPTPSGFAFGLEFNPATNGLTLYTWDGSSWEEVV